MMAHNGKATWLFIFDVDARVWDGKGISVHDAWSISILFNWIPTFDISRDLMTELMETRELESLLQRFRPYAYLSAMRDGQQIRKHVGRGESTSDECYTNP